MDVLQVHRRQAPGFRVAPGACVGAVCERVPAPAWGLTRRPSCCRRSAAQLVPPPTLAFCIGWRRQLRRRSRVNASGRRRRRPLVLPTPQPRAREHALVGPPAPPLTTQSG